MVKRQKQTSSIRVSRKRASRIRWTDRKIKNGAIETEISPGDGRKKNIYESQENEEVVNILFDEKENDSEYEYIVEKDDNKPLITGRRIIDISFFWNQLKNVKHNPSFSCTLANCDIVKEDRLGFQSTFTIRCRMCEAETLLKTDKDGEHMDVNSASVLGTLSIGCGYTQLEEFVSILNIPSVSQRLYNSEHENIGNIVHDIAWEEMERAGLEKAEIATAKGDIDVDGFPCITVIADGAWSKRSYKTNYNALSGVGCIIGEATKKVLYLGVRNKYCTMCARADNRGEEAKEHICFKNWTGSSTSMEANIIVEGFKCSINLHGLKYTKLIGDGDSSVTKNLLQVKPYGATLVEKVECINHLLRNLCCKLKEIAKSPRSTSSNKLVPMRLRKILENRILKFRTGITKAAEYIWKGDGSFSDKIVAFKKDVLNSPDHIFGDHKNCESYFCSGIKPDENLVPELVECGMRQDILRCLQRIVNNSSSCLLNKNNNPAEHFNSLLSKFTGGKRINFSLKRSYEIRCECTAISFNCKEKYIEKIIRASSGHEPGDYTKIHITKRRTTYDRRRKVTLKKKMKPKPVIRKKTICEADEHYGNIEELSADELEERKIKLFKLMKKNDLEILELEKSTRGQSSNPLWKQERSFRLTASNFGQICKRRATTPPENLVKSLLYGKFSGNNATRYGLEYEGIAIQDFEVVTGFQVDSCGLFIGQGEEYFLGASPDGIINEENAIVEVKCPEKLKNICIEEAVRDKKLDFLTLDTDTNELKLKQNHNYWYQIQGQLHITGKEVCYFLVWTPMGLPHIEKIEVDTMFWETKMKNKLHDFFYNNVLPEIIKNPI